MTTRLRKYCCVYNCLNNTHTNPGISFFTLPTDSERRLQWLFLIGREDLTDLKGDNRVCQEHFREEDVQVNTSRRTLKRNAFPSLHLPGLTKEDQETQTDISYVSENGPAIDLIKDSAATQTDLSQISDEISQTSVFKRKLKTELTNCKKQKTHETEQTVAKSQQNMFENLCNRLLTKNLAELVKAQMYLKSSCKGNRYTLAYKMFCLNLYYASPQAYSLLAKTICLPSRLTLNKMNFPMSTEVNDDLMAALKLKVNNMSEKEKQCTLVAGGMSLKPNLFYDIKQDKIIGFHEVDGLQLRSPANYALVILVQGIYVKWSQPIGYALVSECNTENNINNWIDKIILKLFETGLNIRAFASDLNSDLFNLARKRGISADKTYFTLNDHKIYFNFDVPHLIKLIRNNLMTYDFHFDNGAVAKFEHIVQFYEFDCKKTFKQARKLTNNHINPNSFEKNKVRYATQLLSRSVATGLSTCIDFKVIDESARHTAEFIQMMNDLFDALNSSTLSHTLLHKKSFCGDDHQNDFFNNMLTFFQKLKIINSKNGNDVTETVKFIEGFQITMKSVLLLYRDLNQEGYNYLLTRRLNQDQLYNFFGKIKTVNGIAGKPTSRQFISAFRQLCVADIMQALKKGNRVEHFTKFLANLRKFEGIYNENTGLHLPAIVKVETEYNLREIKRSDYSQFEIPKKNAFLYICGALFRKCIDYHNDCDALKSYVDQVTCNLGEESRDLIERNLLMVSPNDFVSNVERMEQVFLKAFEKDHIHSKIGASILNQMKEIELSVPCPCFPKIYLQKLFIRMRIYFALTVNKKAFRSCRERRKYFSVTNF